MKGIRIPIILVVCCFLFSNFHPLAETGGKLIIEVDNIHTKDGLIWIGIYDSANNFLIKEKAIVRGFDVLRTGRMELNIPSLPYGTYAIALFHDINGNGEMDRNWIGIPYEPFAFSKTPRSKWRVPRFDEVKFRFYQNRQVLKTSLANWSAL